MKILNRFLNKRVNVNLLLRLIDEMSVETQEQKIKKTSVLQYFFNQLAMNVQLISGKYPEEFIMIVEGISGNDISKDNLSFTIDSFFSAWDLLKQYMLNKENNNNQFYKDVIKNLMNFNRRIELIFKIEALPDTQMTRKVILASVREACSQKEMIKKINAELADNKKEENEALGNIEKKEMISNSRNLYEKLSDIKVNYVEQWECLRLYMLNPENINKAPFVKIINLLDYFQNGNHINNFMKIIEDRFSSLINKILDSIYKKTNIQEILISLSEDVESQMIFNTLTDQGVSLENKWEKLKIYMSIQSNKKKEFYKMINKVFESFAKDRSFIQQIMNPSFSIGKKEVANTKYASQLAELTKLIDIYRDNQDEANDFFQRILDNYTPTVYQCEESKELYKALQSNESVELKLNKMEAYLFQVNLETLNFHNNGRGLCQAILKVMTSVLEEKAGIELRAS